ncbi:chorismate mutase [Nonomuraea sp. NPDC049421]|uniref:chorismate mutase n=1 Tax=Nonomuraea sp. NPDC049421 TaxID=3155275 RepID=UPI003435F297
MSSTLERQAITLGGLPVGEGRPAIIATRVSLREPCDTTSAPSPVSLPVSLAAGPDGRSAGLAQGATLVEPATSADLPAIAAHADAVVVGASWTRDIPLVRAAAGTGLPVVVERRPGASLEEWLGLADYCAVEGDGRVILCEGGRPDLGLVRAARAASGRPVLVDVTGDPELVAAAVAAGADGLVAGPEGRALAEEAVTVAGGLLRPEWPATLPECRAAIDRVDAALATLLERRVELAGIVQRIKPVGGFAGRDMDRERALVARMAERAPSLGEPGLTPIMNAVIEAGLHLAERRTTP